MWRRGVYIRLRCDVTMTATWHPPLFDLKKGGGEYSMSYVSVLGQRKIDKLVLVSLLNILSSFQSGSILQLIPASPLQKCHG